MWEEDHTHISYYKSQYHSLSFLGGGNNANLMRIEIHFLFPESSFCSSSQKDRCWVHEVGIGPLVPWKVICQVGFDFFFFLANALTQWEGVHQLRAQEAGEDIWKDRVPGVRTLRRKRDHHAERSALPLLSPLAFDLSRLAGSRLLYQNPFTHR